MSERLARILRFVIVGCVNTAVDIALLFALTSAGVSLVLANIVSTSVALGVSFVLNRRFTFRSFGRRGRQLALFLAVTLFGLWVLQPIVIQLTLTPLGNNDIEPSVALLIGKLLATVVSMTWNYVAYSRLVFRGDTRDAADPDRDPDH